MKKGMKRLFLVLLSSLFTLVLTLAVACSGGSAVSVYNAKGELVFDSKTTSVTVEYGATYALPSNVQLDGEKVTLDGLKMYDGEGNECKLSYGSYQFMKTGDYEVHYTVGEETFVFTVTCADTVYPEIAMHAATLYGIVGERVVLPNFTAEDLAGIDRATERFTVTDPDGNETAVADDRSFLIEKVGDYTVTYTIADNNGNVSSKAFTVTGIARYRDETRAESVIYSFNYADYLNLTMDVPEQVDAKHEIVASGYPTIENEAADNKVLKITSEATFDDVYTQFLLHENLLASTGHRIVVRFAVSTDTDYVKLFKDRSSLTDRGLVAQRFGLKANVWYDLEINPISFGYNVEFKDFVLMFRDKGETALYIDEIYFTPIEFEDTQLAEDVIADFDETGYLANIYQNVFGDPTTTRNERVDGSTFSIVSEAELPAANGADTHTPSLAPSGGALKVETAFNRGGVTFMFPQPVDLNEIVSLTFRIRIEKNPEAVVIGFFNGLGYDGGNNRWLEAAKSGYFDGEWYELDFSAEHLKTYTANDEISGFYLYTIARGYPATHGHTVYIDEISVVRRNAVSEQTERTFASFSSESALANVKQNGKYNSSAFAYAEEAYDATGVLAVEPQVSGDGASYYFDKTYKPNVNDLMLIKLATRSTAAKAVKAYALNDGMKVVYLDTFYLSEFVGAFKSVAISGSMLSETGVTAMIGLRFEIVADPVGATATVYFDEIYLYQGTEDDDLPVVTEAADATFSVWQERVEIDLSTLDIGVSDESDPTADWYVVSLSDPSQADITASVVDKKFTPSGAGAYTLTLKGKDSAGNESAEATTITLTVSVYENKAEYYRHAWSFDGADSLGIVTGAEAKRVDLGSGNGGVQALIKHDDFQPSGRTDLTIDMGEVYKVSEIESVVVRYRYMNDAPKATMHLYVNGMDDDVNKRLTGMTYSGDGANWYTPTATNTFATLTIPQASLKSTTVTAATTLLSDDDYLASLSFATPAYRGAAEYEEYRVTMQIDSIEVKRIPQYKAEYLEFDSEDALDIVTSGIGAELVELGDGNKALRATFKNDDLDDPSTTADDGVGTRVDLRIYLGGEYKVSEIESVVIRYRYEQGNGSIWPRIFLNDVTSSRPYGTNLVTWGSGDKSGAPMAEFNTVTISNAGLKANEDGATILTDDDYLSAIAFADEAYRTDLSWRMIVQIDYIRIYLKSGS